MNFHDLPSSSVIVKIVIFFPFCFSPTYDLHQQQGSSGRGGEALVEGQRGGWRAAVWSWGAPVGGHQSVWLHAALTGTGTPSGCSTLPLRNFLSRTPPRTSLAGAGKKNAKKKKTDEKSAHLCKFWRLLRCARDFKVSSFSFMSLFRRSLSLFMFVFFWPGLFGQRDRQCR